MTNIYYFVSQQATYYLSTLLSSSCTTVISTFCISASGFAWAKSNDTARRNAWYSSKPISLACRLYACQKRSECLELHMLNTNKEKDAMIEVLLSEIKNVSVLQHWLDNENWILLDCPITQQDIFFKLHLVWILTNWRWFSYISVWHVHMQKIFAEILSEKCCYEIAHETELYVKTTVWHQFALRFGRQSMTVFLPSQPTVLCGIRASDMHRTSVRTFLNCSKVIIKPTQSPIR